MMHRIVPELDETFAWMVPPILNPGTRLVMVSDAAQGRLVAQGYEAMEPGNQAFSLRRVSLLPRVTALCSRP